MYTRITWNILEYSGISLYTQHLLTSFECTMKSDINSSCYKGDVASCYVQISVDCVFRILELSVGWFRQKEAGWLNHPSVEREYYCL